MTVDAAARPDWARVDRGGLTRGEQDLILPSAGESDLDLFRDRLNAAYYPAVIDSRTGSHQLRGGRLSLRRLRRMTIGFVRFGRDVLVDPGVIDGYHVNLPLAGSVQSECGDQAVLARPGTAAIFTRRGRTRLPSWTADAAQLCVKIDRSLVEDELEMLLGRTLHSSVDFDLSLSIVDGPGREWSRQFWSLIDAIDTEDVPAPVLDYLERATIVKLLYSANHSLREELVAGDDRPVLPRTLREAIELVHRDPQRLHTASDLAAAVGVSLRRLEQSFRDSLGITPSRYLAAVRIEHAHADLAQPAPQESVTAAMYRWGFANHARFASLYRERYGHNPAVTLARARGEESRRGAS